MVNEKRVRKRKAVNGRYVFSVSVPAEVMDVVENETVEKGMTAPDVVNLLLKIWSGAYLKILGNATLRDTLFADSNEYLSVREALDVVTEIEKKYEIGLYVLKNASDILLEALKEDCGSAGIEAAVKKAKEKQRGAFRAIHDLLKGAKNDKQ
jgi:hypothetical protein